jgi:hypothetical protein
MKILLFFTPWLLLDIEKNTIASLQCADGSIATEHHVKAALLWQSFRDRLGVSLSQLMISLISLDSSLPLTI